MRPGDPCDPLLRQVLPVGAETLPVPGYVEDPLQEGAARAVPGLLHKYQGRALLVTTGACAVHCRYCFRRHYDYGADHESQAAHRWSAALAHVAGDASIQELILSGGDPLSLGNARLGQLLQQVREIPHVTRVRIHTRTPVVLPSRVDAGLLSALETVRDRLAIVIHANHPAELDAGTSAALRALGTHCTALLNQSVLLAGINDDAGVLGLLSQRLFRPASCRTTCTSWTRWPARRTMPWTMRARGGSTRRSPAPCPATCCRGWCGRSPAPPGRPLFCNGTIRANFRPDCG